MHGGGRGAGEAADIQERIHRAIETPATLTITQTSRTITFADGRGRSQTLTTDNKRQRLSVDDRTIDVLTRWDDGRLVREMSLGRGMKMTETYSLGSAGRQLQVAMKIRGSRLPQPVNVRRVYDAAPPQ